MLSEISQRENDKYYMIILKNVDSKIKQMYSKNGNSFTDMENKVAGYQ